MKQKSRGLFSSIQEDIAIFQHQLGRRLESRVNLVKTVSSYILNGGKHLRPSILLLTFRCFADKPSEEQHQKAILLALAVEYIHVATLLHDDVVDSSKMRRGQATANIKFDNSSSVLVGDFIYSRSFQLMVESNCYKAIELLSHVTNAIAEGEVLQLMNLGNIDTSVDVCLDIINEKTATLFEAVAEIGALIGGANQKQQEQVSELGKQLGVAFQIIDDILDYTGVNQEMGKYIGDDLSEGKLTLPLVLTYQQANTAEKKRISQIIAQPEHADVKGLLELIDKYKGFQQSHKFAEEAASKALDICQLLPKTIFSENLEQVIKFSINRTH